MCFIYIYIGQPDACDHPAGNPGALRALTPFYRREVELSFAFSVTVPACFDGTRGAPARRPARGLVRRASWQRYAKPSKRRRARYYPKDETLFSEGGAIK